MSKLQFRYNQHQQRDLVETLEEVKVQFENQFVYQLEANVLTVTSEVETG